MAKPLLCDASWDRIRPLLPPSKPKRPDRPAGAEADRRPAPPHRDPLRAPGRGVATRRSRTPRGV